MSQTFIKFVVYSIFGTSFTVLDQRPFSREFKMHMHSMSLTMESFISDRLDQIKSLKYHLSKVEEKTKIDLDRYCEEVNK